MPTGTIVDTNLADDDDDPTEQELSTAEHLGDDPERRYNALLSASPAGVTWVRSQLFTDDLRTALNADTAALRNLLGTYGGWNAERDSKLAALIELLTVTHPDDKVLIFTEYKDTANYIGSALQAAGVSNVGIATGDTDDPTSLAHRFSPAPTLFRVMIRQGTTASCAFSSPPTS